MNSTANTKIQESTLYPTKDESIISVCKEFQDKFGMPDSVLYVSSGLDVSPSYVFDNVTYVNSDKINTAILKSHGCKAVNVEIRLFEKDSDLIILGSDVLARNVLVTKYVIADNKQSEWFKSHPNGFSLETILETNSEDKYVFRRK